MKYVLNPQKKLEEDVVVELVGKTITVSQKPYVEQEIKKARNILERLQEATAKSSVASSSYMPSKEVLIDS